MATSTNLTSNIGAGNVFNIYNINTASKVLMGTNESPWWYGGADPSGDLHGPTIGSNSTGFTEGGPSVRIGCSDQSLISPVSAGGVYVDNNTIAYDGSYIAPLTTYNQIKDNFSTIAYQAWNTSTNSAFTINAGSFVQRNNTTKFDSQTFAATGNIVWNSGASTTTDITSGTATDVRDTSFAYTRYFQLAYVNSSGDLVNLTDAYSDMADLVANSPTSPNDLIHGLLLTPGSIVFGTYYIDHVATGGSGLADQNFDYDIASNFYGYRLTWNRFDPTKILTNIGANGLLSIQFDKASKDQYILDDLQINETLVPYEVVDQVTLSGIKGKFRDASGKIYTNEDIAYALAKGEKIELYGLGRAKDISATNGTYTLSNNIDFVVYNHRLYQKQASGNFVRGYEYNGSASNVKLETSGYLDRKGYYLKKGVGEKLETTDSLIEGFAPVAKSTVSKLLSPEQISKFFVNPNEDNLIFKSNFSELVRNDENITKEQIKNLEELKKPVYYEDAYAFYNDKNVSMSDTSWYDRINPYVNASGSFTENSFGTVGIGLTKISNNHLFAFDNNIILNSDIINGADSKLSYTYRPYLSNTYIPAIGFAAGYDYQKNPYDKPAHYATTGIAFSNYFGALNNFSFGLDLSTINSTGLNQKNDLKDSNMQTWNVKFTPKFRFGENKKYAIGADFLYSRMSAYYDGAFPAKSILGIGADDHFVDTYSANLYLTNYDTLTKNGAITINGSVTKTKHNSKDNPNPLLYQGGIKYTEEDYGFSVNGGYSDTSAYNKPEKFVNASVEYKFNL